jgi:ubiquinone/menaquinone biosynthesis C-methylase UbiE
MTVLNGQSVRVSGGDGLEQQARVAGMFDELADSYDAVGVEFFGPIAEGLVLELAPRPGERALDMGCGRGAVLFRVAAAVGPTGSVTGVDLSKRMIEATARDATNLGMKVDLRVADAMAPALPSASYDLLASSLVLFFLPDALTALRNWRDFLVKGGRIGVSTFGPYDQHWANRVDTAMREHAPIPAMAPAAREGPFASDAGMERLLTEARYRDIRTVTATASPRFADPEHWYRWSLTTGRRGYWAAIPDNQRERVKADLFAVVDACRDEDGRIGFDQQVRYTLAHR